MSTCLRVAIVGGGIAGTALAAHLSNRGHCVEGYDRSTAAGDGAGLLLAPPALALLSALRLEHAARASGALVCGLRARQTDGELLLDWNARRWGHACIGVGIERRVLHELLLRAAASVTWHRGLGIDHVDAERGWITDVNGERRGPYDLVVASDGAGSRLRAFHPELVSRVHHYGWTALSCLMRSAPGVEPRTQLEQSFRGPHHVASWPVGAANDAGQLLCMSANVPAESARRFAEPDSGLGELHRLGFASAGLDLLRPVGPWITLSARDVVMRRYFRGRLVFVGDAAHSLSPQLGQGARLALAGAANLTAALERYSIAEALAAYDRCQRNLASLFQYWSRWLTPVFQSQGRSTMWIRDRIISPLSRFAPIERELSRLLCGPAEAG